METTDYKGYMITIDQDINESDPPYEWTTPEDRGATFALEHKRYSLPFELDNKYDEEGNNLVDLSLYNSWKEFAEACAPEGQKVYKFVRWYEHSGIAVSLRDEEEGQDWDAGIVGVIFGEDTNAIQGAFEDFRCYIEGDIWSVTVEGRDGELVDSLGCIYTIEQARLEGEYIVDYQLTLPRAGHKPKHARELHR